MRWLPFFFITLLTGVAQVGLGMIINPAYLPYMPCLLLVIAFYSACEGDPAYILPTFWWCGFVQDLFLGVHLGSHILLYSLAAWPLFHLRIKTPRLQIFARLLILLTLVFATVVVAPFLDGTFAARSALALLKTQAGVAGLTLLAAPGMGMFLDLRWLRTWRVPSPYYGFAEG